MIFQSFLLGNLVSLCMKIINSMVGLYYGFLTTFSISYLFLLRAQVMEEGTEKNKGNNLFYYGTAHDVHIDLLCASASSIG